MNINSDVWGSPQTNFDTINQRTGAVDLNDNDYEDFPPFVTCDLSFGESTPPLLSTQSLWVGALIKPQYFYFDAPIDKTIAYCACKNPDIFTAQYAVPFYGLYDEPYADMQSPREAFKLISDDTPTPYIFMSAYPYSNDGTSGITTTTTQLYNPYYPSVQAAHTTSLYYPRGTNTAEYDTKAHINNANKNLLVSYWRDFGLRSLFGVIRVAYIDNTYNANTGLPTAPTTSITLKAYEDNNEEWKSTHNIVAAWLSIYFRRNIDGTYSSSRPVGQFFGVDCSFQAKASGFDGGEIWQPIMNYYKNANSYLPLFGHTGAGVGTTTNVQYQATISTNASGGTNTTSYMLCGMGSQLEYVKHGKQEDTSSTEGIRTWWCELPYTETEKLRKAAAAYGLYFADDVYDLADAGRDDDRWTDENMCLGVVDEDGYTDGTYTRGTGNEGANNFLWKTASESKYDPSKPPPVGPDPTQYSDETGFNILGGVANCNKVYAVNAGNIMNLAKALSTAITTRLSDLPPLDYSIETFLTNNPLDCVVSLRKYPVANLSTGTEEPIAFGSYQNANVQGIPFIKSYEKVDFNFSVAARNSLYPHFGDFRDYEPYTHAELIVPFCGTVQINPSDFIGHDINVYMIIDYITGGCTAYIAADRLVVTSISGTVAVDVPLSGIQQATLESQRVNAVMARKSADISLNNAIVGGLSSSIGLLGSAASGNVLGAVGSGAGLTSSIGRIEQADLAYQKADYEVKHMQVPFKQVSAGTPIASTVIENCCRLIIYRPILDEHYDAEVYAKTIGFACLMNGKVKDFSGLTQGNINVNGLNITETEKQLIKKAFASGVIL